MDGKIRIDEAMARRLAVEADVDPRTIKRVLRGECLQSINTNRARLVLLKYGYDVPDFKPRKDDE